MMSTTLYDKHCISLLPTYYHLENLTQKVPCFSIRLSFISDTIVEEKNLLCYVRTDLPHQEMKGPVAKDVSHPEIAKKNEVLEKTELEKVLEKAECIKYIPKFLEEEITLSDIKGKTVEQLIQEFGMKKFPAQRLQCEVKLIYPA